MSRKLKQLGLSVLAFALSACGGRSFDYLTLDEGTFGGTNSRSSSNETRSTAPPVGSGGQSSLSTTAFGSGGITSSHAGGSANRGGSSATGGGSATPATHCQQPSDCILVSRTCCGSCGPEFKENMIAISKSGVDAYRQLVCGAGPTICPLCATMNNPDLVATCKNGTCELVLLTESTLSLCGDATDCYLRAKTCCECGASMDTYNLVALSKEGRIGYPELVCDATAVCPQCMPLYPTSALVTCDAGHCALKRN